MFLCRRSQWRQCSAVDRNGVSDSVSIDRNCRRRYFEYPKRCCLKTSQHFVRLSRLAIRRRGRHWWLAEVDVLSGGKRQWHIASFFIVIVLSRLCHDLIRWFLSWQTVATRCTSLSFSACRDFVAVASAGGVFRFTKVVGPGGGVVKHDSVATDT